MTQTAEQKRLLARQAGAANWQKWGPYLSERAWGTVREDYSPYGSAWDYFPHDHARSRAYRWNEDGLAGVCDRRQYLYFALALWNGRRGFHDYEYELLDTGIFAEPRYFDVFVEYAKAKLPKPARFSKPRRFRQRWGCCGR